MTEHHDANPFVRVAQPRGLSRWIPAFAAVRTYQPSWLPKDIVAGLVLTAILVPVGMGYAEAAGLPAISSSRALASQGCSAMKRRPCIGAASNAVGTRSSECVTGCHVPTDRIATPPGPRASVGGAHGRRPTGTRPPWPG